MARILNVITATSSMGGTITKLRALMRASKHQHYLYHPGYNSNKENIEKEIPFYESINVKAFYGIHNRNIWAHVKDINKIIKEYDIEIVHYYFNFEHSFAPFVKLCNPNVIQVRSIVGFDMELSLARRLLINVGMHSVDNYVLISNYIKNLYEQTYPVLKRKNTRIIYNGAVNVNEISQPLEERKCLVTTSGICERKNVGVLVEAMNIIKNEYHRTDIKLNILGDGDRWLVEDPMKEYRLEDVINIVGYTKEVPKYLDDCAIYVHPATTEGFGIAVTEAMQMYCPCIVADKGALPELVVDNANGFVVDAYNARQWAEKIIYLTDNKETRLEFAYNSHKRAIEAFSLQAFIDNHDLLYDSLINDKK